jgi:hypothetical protein
VPSFTNLVLAPFFLALTATAFAADIDAKGSVPAIAADGDLVAIVLPDKLALACEISRDGGDFFGPPVPLGTVEPGQMLGMRRGPQVAVRNNTVMVVTNNAKGNRVVAFRSTDAGKTWEGPTFIDAPSGRSPEGLMSMAPTRDGFAVAFLELVEKSMRVSLIRSTDDGKSWLGSRLVYSSPDGHVCECCQPTITSDRKGNVAVMFRNWLAGNRDMYVTTSRDDGRSFGPAEKLGIASWKLNACPMDGGNLVFDGKGEGAPVLAVFRRESTLYTARPGEPEKTLGGGKNAVIASTSDGPVIAWETRSGVTVRIPKAPDITIDTAAAPVLTHTSRGILLAYSTQEAGVMKSHTRLVWDSKAP